MSELIMFMTKPLTKHNVRLCGFNYASGVDYDSLYDYLIAERNSLHAIYEKESNVHIVIASVTIDGYNLRLTADVDFFELSVLHTGTPYLHQHIAGWYYVPEECKAISIDQFKVGMESRLIKWLAENTKNSTLS